MRNSLVLACSLLLACSSCGKDDPPAKSAGTSGGNATGTSGGTPLPTPSGPGTFFAGCRIFPNDNAWNQDVSGLEVDTGLMSSVMPQMATATGLHPDWGTDSDGYGIPITSGPPATPAAISFSTSYGPRETDKLACPSGGGEFCYPIPTSARTEGGGDRHILFISQDGAPDHCTLYELFAVEKQGSGFSVGSGAIFKLDSNALRTEGWTSADAAGLPIMPGLVRKDEITKGEITHAIRFTMAQTRDHYIHPATHAAGKANAGLPPMGLRLRLKASFAEGGYSGPSLVVIKAMKKYGIILADNGSNWYLSGEMNQAWSADMDNLVSQMKKVKGSDFEIVKTGTPIQQPD